MLNMNDEHILMVYQDHRQFNSQSVEIYLVNHQTEE